MAPDPLGEYVVVAGKSGPSVRMYAVARGKSVLPIRYQGHKRGCGGGR